MNPTDRLIWNSSRARWIVTSETPFDGTNRPVPRKYRLIAGPWGAGAAKTSPSRVEVADVGGRVLGNFYVRRDDIDPLIRLLTVIRDNFDGAGNFHFPDQVPQVTE